VKPELLKLMKVFLALVALHSFCVGVGLIALPLGYFDLFGLGGYQGAFFKTQGGVFHIVMCGAYLPAAMNPVKNILLVRFSIFAKFTATVFLLSYAFIYEMAWIILVSGILDLLMGLVLYWFHRKLNRVRV
jgi:hypothetical protein